MNLSSLELVNESFTMNTLADNTKVIFLINQIFLDSDPRKIEELLQPHQVRNFDVVVDDCALRNIPSSGKPGGQCMNVDKQNIQFMLVVKSVIFKLRNQLLKI